MAERRPDGALEGDVLRILWANADGAMTPGEVRTALGGSLAYTTVMTVLSRLWTKGVLEREAQGRGFAYRPMLSESDLISRRMAEALAVATDPASALARFVGALSKKDMRHLRRLLSETERA